MMRPIELAQKHFADYKIRGTEIVPAYCPFCHGGHNKDKHTFALNIEKGTWNCKRGSCGMKGTFRQLLEHFGEIKRVSNYELKPRRKTYVKPKTPVVSKDNSQVEKYLRSRGISPETWQRRKVFQYRDLIAFPYYENGELVLMKFRPARALRPGEQKAHREKGGKPVFWGMDDCDSRYPLVIVEGEIDALTLDEVGWPNTVSVPSGASDLTCIDECWDWLEQFDEIFIWPDQDSAGLEMLRKMITRLGAWRCSVINVEYKDANEMLLKAGKDAIIDAIESAQPVPMQGLIRLSDVEPFDPAGAKRILTGISGIDAKIGGLLFGEVSVWTGVNGSGKSTLLGQLMLEAVNQNHAVCAYSGELPGAIFRYWIDLQAAGPRHLTSYPDIHREEPVVKPTPEATKAIREWYRDKFFLFDHFGSATPESLFEVFEYAARRYGAKMFLIDNLMTMMTAEDQGRYFRQQSDFVKRAVDFAHKHEVHVHIVAHPRKSHGRITKMDIAGTGDITNRADNVFAIHRITDKERSDLPESLKHCDAALEIFKSRMTGQQDVVIGLNFCEKSKRFYMPSAPEGPEKPYGWQHRVVSNWYEGLA